MKKIKLILGFFLTLVVISCQKKEQSLFPDSEISDEQTQNFEAVNKTNCNLDWEIEYHNNDGDFCRNVAIKVNGLTGSCANCEITTYSLVLNKNGEINNTDEEIVLGLWVKPNTRYIWQNEYNGLGSSLGNQLVDYSSSTQFQSLIELGGGEVIDFDYLTGFHKDVSLCVEMTINCNGINESCEFCQNVDLLCW